MLKNFNPKNKRKAPVEEEADKEKAVESMKLPSPPKKKNKKMTQPKIKDLFKRKD